MDIDKTKMMKIKAVFNMLEKKVINIDGVDYFTFKGYGSTFGNIDRDDEMMVAGCFREHIASQTPALLWQHQMSEPLGVYTVVREDGKGLYVEGQMPMDDDFVRGRVVPQMKAGSVKTMSIGFTVDEYAYDKENDIIKFTKVKVWEISLVTIPANAQAMITEMKSLEEAENITELNQMLKNYGISHRKCNIIISKIKEFVRDEQNKERDVQSYLKEFVEEIRKIKLGGK